MKMNRRKFVVSAAAVAGAPALQTGKGGPLGANDRIICAFVGTGGMGRSNMRDFLRSGQVRAAAVCDVWDHNRGLTLQMTAEQEGGKAAGYKDFRRVLDLMGGGRGRRLHSRSLACPADRHGLRCREGRLRGEAPSH